MDARTRRIVKTATVWLIDKGGENKRCDSYDMIKELYLKAMRLPMDDLPNTRCSIKNKWKHHAARVCDDNDVEEGTVIEVWHRKDAARVRDDNDVE